MNKNEYRRALIMLRSLKSGLSGYVRLERRTLMGTLQFTVNGVSSGQTLHAVLLRPQNGAWVGVKAGDFSAPRYGQTGLLWKFDPRNIDGKDFEQYPLTAVIGIDAGVCDLLLCGNLNGSVDADWSQIRDAACRLYNPVRISGTPIPPIPETDDEPVSPNEKDTPQTLPDYSEEIPAYPGPEEDTVPSPESPIPDTETPPSGTDAADDSSGEASPPPDQPTADKAACASSTAVGDAAAISSGEQTEYERCDCDQTSSSASSIPDEAFVKPDMPATESNPMADAACSTETTAFTDELDIPAMEPKAATVSARVPGTDADELDTPAMAPDELDVPAAPENEALLSTARAALHSSQAGGSAPSNPSATVRTAGDQLNLTDPDAPWPASAEPLRSLFFSSEAIVPFREEGYVFIRAPLPEESGYNSCIVGIQAENGVPVSVLYALPSVYSPEPPAGLEGYAWRGDQARGYWFTVETLDEAPSTNTSRDKTP